MSVAAFAQQAPTLGALYEFGALASSHITNTGNTIVHANLGLSGGSLTGFPPGSCEREIHERTATARQAVDDARAAYAFMWNQPSTSILAPGNLHGVTITPGVYTINGDAFLNGTLTLNGQDRTNPVFIIKVNGNLTITRAEYEQLNNTLGINLYWLVDGNVLVQSGAAALGNILSDKGDVVMEDGAQLQGRIVACKGRITLTNNILNHPSDLAVRLAKSPGSRGEDTYGFGEEITYTVIVRNNGPTNEEGVKTEVQFTGVMQSYSSSVPGATFNGTTWDIGKLNYQEEVTLTIVAKIDRAGSGYLRGLVYGYGIDEVRPNNTANLSFCVLLSETGEISGPAEVCVNDSFVYSIAPVDGATRYTWSVPQGWSFVPLGQTSIRVTVGVGKGFVKVTASNTCGEGPPRTLEVNATSGKPVQPGPITGPEAICKGTESLTYSIAPVPSAISYEWIVPNGWTVNSGQGTTEINVSPNNMGGTVSVAAINACGKSDPQALVVTVYDGTPVAPSEIIGTVQGCAGSVVPFQVAEMPSVSRFVWSVPGNWVIEAGQGTNRILVRVGSVSGDISVYVENGCGTSAPVAKPVSPVTAPATMPGPISGDVYTCINKTGLEYFIDPVATASSYRWTVPDGWTIVSGQGTVRIVVNAGRNGGEIAVEALNDCGPSGSSAVTVAPADGVPSAPGPITGIQFGCVGNTATYSIEAVAGVSSYTWTVPNGWTIVAGQGTTTIEVTTGTASGNVTVAATNGCGIGAVSELAVAPQTSPPAPPANINGPSEVCQGEAGYVYSVNPAISENGYTWIVPSGWVITSGQGTSSITVTAGATGGAVTVAARNECGEGNAASLNVTVVPSPPDQPSEISGPPSTCVNQQNLVYSIAPVAHASSYVWSVGDNGWVIVSGQGTTSIVVRAGVTSTTVSVKAINACGITGETQLATVVTNAVPVQPGPIAGTTTPCVGGTYTFSIDPVTNAFKYNWSVPTSWEILENNNTSIVVKTNNTAGTVTVTAENGCGPGAAQSLQVTPSTAVPTAPEAILGNVDACANGEATFSVKEIAGISSYTWTVPTGWNIISGQGTAAIVVRVGTTTGDVTVTSMNDCGAGGSITRRILLNTAPPITPGAISGSPQACTNSTATFSIDPVSTASAYTWVVPNDWVILSGQGTTSIEVKVGKTTGDVRVTATNSCGNSGASFLAVAVAEGVTLTPGAIAAPTGSFCQGTTGLQYNIAPIDGALSYTWTVPAGWAIVSGQGTTNITVTAGSAAGQVTVTVGNACGSGGTASVEAKPQVTPLTPKIIVGSVNPCQNASTTYSVTASATGTVDAYIWEVPAGWRIISGQNTNSVEVVANSTAGKIKVAAKNSCGTSEAAEITVEPAPAAPVELGAIVGPVGICAGSTVTYTIEKQSSGAAYNWQIPAGWSVVSGQGTATITVVAGQGAGTITVTGQNGCGSTNPSSLNVSNMPAEGAAAIIDRSSPCVGLVYEVEPVPGATNYTWAVPAGWSITSGQGTPKIAVEAGLGNGDITLVVSNGGCTDQPLSITPNLMMPRSDLHFPNVFSPNNDGTHDIWKIENLQSYPDNEVTIINRWGNQVYYSKSYQNNWTGDNLSEGTYYYVVRVKLCDGKDKMFKGYVMIVR